MILLYSIVYAAFSLQTTADAIMAATPVQGRKSIVPIAGQVHALNLSIGRTQCTAAERSTGLTPKSHAEALPKPHRSPLDKLGVGTS